MTKAFDVDGHETNEPLLVEPRVIAEREVAPPPQSEGITLTGDFATEQLITKESNA